MPQGPIPINALNSGGINSDLNNTTTQVIKGSPGRLRKIMINNAGSSGAFTLNDCATVAAATPANVLFTLPFNSIACYAGSVITADLIFKTGLVMSAVPGGSPNINFTFD